PLRRRPRPPAAPPPARRARPSAPPAPARAARRSLHQLLVVLRHPLLVLLRRRLLHGVEQLLAELGGRARRLRVRYRDVVVAHAVRLGPFLVIAVAGRLAPAHGDAALADAAPAG